MPDLPTITVSQAHFDRLVAAFPGATLAEKSRAYKDWLTNRLIDKVLESEAANVEIALQQERVRRQAEIVASLPPRPEPTPQPPPTPPA